MRPEQPRFQYLFRMLFPPKTLFPDLILLDRTGIYIGKTPVHAQFHEIFVRSCTVEEEEIPKQRFVDVVDANQWLKGAAPITNTFLHSPTRVCTPIKPLLQEMSLQTSPK